MGRQSARIRLNGKDHKEIRLNGNFHNSAHRDSNVLWEKILEPEVYNGLELTTYAEYRNNTVTFQAKGNFTVDWGDGTVENFNKSSLSSIVHSYNVKIGTKSYYDVIVSGSVTDLSFNAANGLSAVKNALPPSLREKTDFSLMFAYLNEIDLTINADLFKYCSQALKFDSCFLNSNLLEIPAGLFRKCKAATSFSGCFRNTKITAIPDGLFASLITMEDLSYCFYGCSLLTSIGNDILAMCKSVKNLSNFLGYTNITEIKEGMLDDLEELENAERMCMQCTSLLSIPYTLFDKCLKISNVVATFYNCNGIESSLPPLWERTWENYSQYRGCYYYCLNAENYNDISLPYFKNDIV